MKQSALNLETKWRSLNVPTVLMRGESSQHLSEAEFQYMLQEQKMAKGVTVEHAGHFVHYENKVGFLNLLKTKLVLDTVDIKLSR